ncbi:alpha/beta fold hydrolase [Massilia sp. R2A-15]|uniref:alpha/beta fold hydrolase n=1 Tax=Massilia sp. R2A-15 TaxID=3064278 RepID=UPI0027365832|nr:alpha/beta fold hydrolase [Massilia sp. R2A-15]WLI89735.1 alpha/beta fold hydrolase [Massilia sp. R2A-15]
MKFRSCLGAALTALALLPAASQAAAPTRACHLPGAEEPLRCVSLPVALDYAKPDGAKLKLHVTIAPAFRESARPDPLFVLAGGPGQAGSDVLQLLNSTFRRIRATRDIVFIDQRGTGLSGKLDCESTPAQEAMTEEQLEAEIVACIKRLNTNYAAYGTASAARDIDQVRQALGYGKINLWGGSYGTRLAQAYARAYPAQVRSLTLDGVAAPDQVIPAGGRDSQAALEALFRQCAAEPACARAFPNARAEFTALSAKVAAGGVKVEIADPRTAAPLKLPMTSTRFLGTVHSILYSPADSRRLPFLIHSAAQGRWEPFIARRNVSADLSADGAHALVLQLAVICAEDMPRLTPSVLAEDAGVLTAPMAARLPALCRAIAVPPVPLASPTPITAPTLMLSGALDPVTPPRRAEAAGKFMTHAQHLVVANAGHGISWLGCTPRLLREFLDRPDAPVQAECLKDIPVPGFQLGSAGPQP